MPAHCEQAFADLAAAAALQREIATAMLGLVRVSQIGDAMSLTHQPLAHAEDAGIGVVGLGLPSAESLAKVRDFNRRNLELNAYLRREDVAADRRAMLGLEPPAPQRSATEDEIVSLAAQLDAGGVLNPRLWVEHFKVSEQAQREAA